MIRSTHVYVQVQSMYIEMESQPEAERYIFAYTITLRNLGRYHVRLISRYWLITNANGQKTKVQGEGVVGKQPLILAGNNFQYTSCTVLETPLGIMQGHYEMVDHQNHGFYVAIPTFRLAIPALIN